MIRFRLKSLCLLIVILTGAVKAFAKEDIDITVFATKSGTGSVWNSKENVPEYLVTYKVTVDNLSQHPIELNNQTKMCFYLFDHSGYRVNSSAVGLELLTKYKAGDSHSGLIIFKSNKEDINTLPFVRLEFKNTCD
ncbi:DUF4354 family protein [Enterobacter cancerogenus]|nr:DUF4354 family protein [Enterobacter cancerogenus]